MAESLTALAMIKSLLEQLSPRRRLLSRLRSGVSDPGGELRDGHVRLRAVRQGLHTHEALLRFLRAEDGDVPARRWRGVFSRSWSNLVPVCNGAHQFAAESSKKMKTNA